MRQCQHSCCFQGPGVLFQIRASCFSSRAVSKMMHRRLHVRSRQIEEETSFRQYKESAQQFRQVDPRWTGLSDLASYCKLG